VNDDPATIDRHLVIVRLREQTDLTFDEIGKIAGCSRPYCVQTYLLGDTDGVIGTERPPRSSRATACSTRPRGIRRGCIYDPRSMHFAVDDGRGRCIKSGGLSSRLVPPAVVNGGTI